MEVVVAGPAPQSLRKAVRRGSEAGQVVDDGYTLVFPVSAQTSAVRTAMALRNPGATVLVVQCAFQTADIILDDADMTLWKPTGRRPGSSTSWFHGTHGLEGGG